MFNSRLRELLTELSVELNTFFVESHLYFKGNKSAGIRARKSSLKLRKILLKFRLESLKNK